ncbi:unnamed protein product [Didymodactylos carnosus]|uniref:Uncharacterized protein n=1 Tax=Didymodactylos carnosus TaxID=1234261 RepID=A0A8S2HA01_9BILA|nr:unnamed protein product [Didymodactylos carnosus]CAF3619197.1 unnamed protein product [Didymodactylos carnosus]
MGNIQTAAGGLLPTPGAAAAVGAGSAWWINRALAIWAICALLLCELLALLCLLRYCCQRKYGEKVDGFAHGQHVGGGNSGGVYTTQESRRFTAPPPPTDNTYREIIERQTIQDDYLGAENENTFHRSNYIGAGARSNPYVFTQENVYESEAVPTVAIITSQTPNDKLDSVSERSSYSSGRSNRKLLPNYNQSGITENIETNITRNITKNITINEEENYQILHAPPIEQDLYYVQQNTQQHLPPPPSRTTVTRLQGPYTTRINMGAEHIVDAPQWEETTPLHIQYESNDDDSSNILARQNKKESNSNTTAPPLRNVNPVKLDNPKIPIKRASIEIVNEEPIWEQAGKYETLVNDSPRKRTLDDSRHSRSDNNLKNSDYERTRRTSRYPSPRRSVSSDNLDRWPTPPNVRSASGKVEILPYNSNIIMRTRDTDSTTSDQNSMYESIVVKKNGRQRRSSTIDDDIYKTAGVDEVEIEMRDLVQRQKSTKMNVYDDILPSAQTTNGTLITPVATIEQQVEHEQTITNVVRKNVEVPIQRQFQTRTAMASGTYEHLTNDYNQTPSISRQSSAQ